MAVGVGGTVLAAVGGGLVWSPDGRSFSPMANSSGLVLGSQGLVPDAEMSSSSQHDFGRWNGSQLQDWSNRSNQFKLVGGVPTVIGLQQRTSFEGIPGAISLSLERCSLVRFGDGTMLQTAVVWDDQGVPSVVLVQSSNGFRWEYRQTIFRSNRSSTKGIEHALEMIDFGQLLFIACPGVSVTSFDGGLHWTAPQVLPTPRLAGTPRLKLLGDGFAPLLLSGLNTESWADLGLWVDWTGMAKFPAPTPDWQQTHSLSYLHNTLAPASSARFTAGVNTSGAATETSGHSSFVALSECSVVWLYDVWRGGTGLAAGFAMRLDFHMDAEGETGLHC
eukprot:TRINITY_DN4915_c0_g1_i2.p1 TRINITY_DN4915_c0_g1~~TRINITY_DN4915_c0_g1_i2.p1  ORF type:complete len:333 (+),score=56.73 TRINITY_DN4915_c0_g1_i2:298-1296(+)